MEYNNIFTLFKSFYTFLHGVYVGSRIIAINRNSFCSYAKACQDYRKMILMNA